MEHRATRDPCDGTAPTPHLALYRGGFDRGRPALVEAAWLVVSAILVASALPGSRHRVALLRLFGARIGPGAVIKPGVKIKLPWRLSVGANAWIGEAAWIDNLAQVSIGADACVSQGAYLCTGNHDWSSPTFDLATAPITIESGGWVAARAVVGPGVTIGRNAVVALGAVASADLAPGAILVAGGTVLDRRRTVREAP